MISLPPGPWPWSWSRFVKDHGLQYLLVATLLTGRCRYRPGVARRTDAVCFAPGRDGLRESRWPS